MDRGRRTGVLCLSLALLALGVLSQEAIPEGCECQDTQPPGEFSCGDQVQFGKCDEQWLKDGKFCEFSCGVCKCGGGSEGSSEGCEECPNEAPSPDFTCEEQVKNGACGQSWMEGFCRLSCGECTCPESSATNKTGGASGTPEGETNFFGADEKAKNGTEEADEGTPAAGGAGGAANTTGSGENSTAAAGEGPSADTPRPSSKPAGSTCFTILDTVESNSDLSQLAGLLEKAEFIPVVDDVTFEATFFAPTNDAIEAFSKSLGKRADDLLENPEFLTKVLNYHVSKPALFEEEMADGDALTTMAGKAGSELELAVVESQDDDFLVSIKASDGTVANFVETDIVACESIVHVIDAVLVSEEATTAAQADPAKPGTRKGPKSRKAAAGTAPEGQAAGAGDCKTVLDVVKDHPDLTSLAGAVQSGGVVDVFSDAGLEATVFAPSSEAFEVFGKSVGSDIDELLGDPDFLKQLLAYHITLSPLLADEISPGDSIPTTTATPSGLVAADASLKAVKSKKGAGIAIKGFRNKGTVVEADLQACDSVVHVIDRVLLSKDLFSLVNAKGKGGSSQGATDSSPDGAAGASGDAADATEDELTETLAEVASAPEASDSEDEPAEDEPKKKKKKKGKKSKGQNADGEVVVVNTVEFTNSTALPDGMLTDLIQVVEEEIAKLPDESTIDTEPGCTTIVRAVEMRPELSVLKDAFDKGGFFRVVSNSNLSATFLAPTNEAFKTFIESLGPRATDLMTDPTFLSKLLAYHVAIPAHRRGELKPGDKISTLASLQEDGASLTVIKSNVGDEQIAFADAVGVSQLVEQDIEACNCIVHIIDKVLVSGEVAEVIG
ncbi:unnamed protein product [Ostreobium quekettii]|uniref:Uncharacterized protein n=1 Tax=Ostreobium quekettii TaxID=121088 RepID=A0A8S1ISV9_9CHLO|nr:unnamed protein product [Ostreobium quekettii]|eukprot:evm.model.scf_345.3 EVM.evm.TU.scf_345.3   scf_345:43862-52491(+)